MKVKTSLPNFLSCLYFFEILTHKLFQLASFLLFNAPFPWQEFDCIVRAYLQGKNKQDSVHNYYKYQPLSKCFISEISKFEFK